MQTAGACAPGKDIPSGKTNRKAKQRSLCGSLLNLFPVLSSMIFLPDVYEMETLYSELKFPGMRNSSPAPAGAVLQLGGVLLPPGGACRPGTRLGTQQT